MRFPRSPRLARTLGGLGWILFWPCVIGLAGGWHQFEPGFILSLMVAAGLSNLPYPITGRQTLPGRSLQSTSSP